MANPNPEIYGTAETWQNNYMFGGLTSNIASVLHAVRPKCATWGNSADYSSSQLRSGITANKIMQNQPIDKSIVPVGQGMASAFKSIAVYHLDSTNHLILDNVARPNGGNVINGVFGDFSSRSEYGVAGNNSCSRGLLDWYKRNARVWSPESANIEGNNRNGNYYISPFVYYESRSILMQIEVAVCNNETVPDNPTAVPASTWRSLEEWKTLFPTYKIVGIRIKGLSLNAYNSNTGDMTYAYTTYDSSTSTGYSHSLVWSPLDGIEIADNGDYYLYALFNSSATSGLVTMGYNTTPLYKWEGQSQYYVLMPFYDEFKDYLKYYTDDNVGGRIWYQIPYSAEIYETIMQACSCFGCPFTPTSTRVFNQSFTHTDLCLPIINDDGVANGEYTRGTDNLENDFIDLKTQWDKNYDPAKHVDPNTYSDTTNWNNVNFQQAFTKRYLLTGSQVGDLATELWAAQSSKPADIDYHNFAIDEYLTNNPIDTIVSLKYFPCTFADVAPAVVHLGKYTTNIAATALGTSVRIIDFAPIECFQHFDDFRDYEPYTELAMYIPFCGTVKIPTAECMGNYVSVKLAIDTSTGAATGYVIVSKSGTGGICVATCQGMAAIDIPVSGLQSANLANAVFNATANWTQTQINNISANSGLFKHMGGAMGAIARGMTNSVGLSDVKGGVLGGPIGAAGTLVNSLNPISAMQKGLNIDIDNAKADYELSHIQVPTRLVGSASPALGCVIELDCRLIIYRPVTDETALSNYADTVGFATVKGGTVGQFSGFTIGTIDVSGINATAKEKQAIAAAFANGVYL